MVKDGKLRAAASSSLYATARFTSTRMRSKVRVKVGALKNAAVIIPAIRYKK
jgi:hypothetical protein